jgi:hypothetical protein
MERDFWKCIATALRRLPRCWRRNASYHDGQILAVFFWAALHDRPVSWACRRTSWPPQAWRRELPDQSTMSRRLRHPLMREHLIALLSILQRDHGLSTQLIVDGKALPVSEYTTDVDARTGWGAGRYMKGYKLHLLIDAAWRVLAWRVRPMNEAEPVVAGDLLRDAAAAQALPKNAVMLGDRAYDSNPLHETAAAHGVQLVAPQKNAAGGLGHRDHHPGRLHSLRLTKGTGARRWWGRRRGTIERFFGALASAGGGLATLPSWARREHRTDLWVGAKLIIHAARISHTRRLAA